VPVPEIVHMAHLLGTRIDKTADAMAESGVTAVEAGFPLDPAMGGTMKETAVTADRAFRNAGIEVRVVHPALGLERDLSSADDALRASTVEHYRLMIEVCGLFGARFMIVHAGDRYTPGECAESVKRAADSVGSFVDLAAATGVTLVVENLPSGYVLESGREVFDFVEAFDSPTVRACYDSGHANITDHPAHAIGVMAPVLGHLHLHDNDGTADQHRMPGEGSIDWGAVGDALRTACYGGPALLELALADGHTAASMRSRTLELMGYAAE